MQQNIKIIHVCKAEPCCYHGPDNWLLHYIGSDTILYQFVFTQCVSMLQGLISCWCLLWFDSNSEKSAVTGFLRRHMLKRRSSCLHYTQMKLHELDQDDKWGPADDNAAHCLFFQVHLFVCNEDEDIKAAFDVGATGVMTDYPTVLSRFLCQNQSQDCGQTALQ